MKGIIALTGQTRTYKIGVTIALLAPIFIVLGFVFEGELSLGSGYFFLAICCSFGGMSWNYNQLKCPVCGEKWMKELRNYNAKQKSKITLFSLTQCPKCKTDFANADD